MNSKQNENEIDEQNILLGTHKTDEEIKKEAQEEKKAKKEARKSARLAIKAQAGEDKVIVRFLVILLVVIIAGVAIMIVADYLSSGKDVNESLGHFYNTSDNPELYEEGYKGVIPKQI